MRKDALRVGRITGSTVPMSTFRADLIAENERLKAENERLRAQIAGARADGAWNATLKQARELTPRQAENMRLGMLAYLDDWAKRGGDAAWRAAARRSLSLEPEAETTSTFAEPAAAPVAEPGPVRQHSFEEVTQATPEEILRAKAIAEGRVTPLPADPTARAILKAHAQARDPDGSKAL
jgi:hypothetical protein